MKQIHLKYYFIFVLLIISKTMMAQASADVHLLKDSILIGDQIPLTLSITLNEKAQSISFPTLDDSLKKIEVIESGKIDSLQVDNRYLYQQKIIITSFDSGRYEIPSLVFQYTDANGNPQNLQSQSVFLNVNTIAVDTTKDFKPINEILPQEAPDLWTKIKDNYAENKWWYIIGGILILLLIALFIYLKFFRKKKEKQEKIIEIPYQKALRLLKELEQKAEWEKGEYKIYYTQLSDIIRDYLESSSGINANEMTTRDLLKTVKKSQELRSIHQELRMVLNTSDLAKFAKSIPTDEERVEAHKSAVKIVNQTKPNIQATND